jgi:F0F1-type ATP synthase assembly protein I
MAFSLPLPVAAVAPGSELRRLAARIALTQLAVTMITAAMCAVFGGLWHGASGLAGGLIAVAANVPMTLALLGASGSPRTVLYKMCLGQLAKAAFTIAMLFIVARTPWVRWLPLLGAYVAALAVFWWVPFAASRRSAGHS